MRGLIYMNLGAGAVLLLLFPNHHPGILLTPAGIPFYGFWGVAAWLTWASWKAQRAAKATA